MGMKASIDSGPGMDYYHVGVAANINDGNTSSRVDDWSGDIGPYPELVVSYVGVLWPDVRYDEISSLVVTFALFSDGGWFGVSGTTPGNAAMLSDQYLTEPTIQVTTDGAAPGRK
jgi:hypothetical protein